MFKEKLHDDIDRITPSAELLDRVSLMMKEEASRKKPKIYITAAKYASLAAAVCLITAVAVMLSNTAGDNAIQTKDLARSYEETVSDMNMMSSFGGLINSYFKVFESPSDSEYGALKPLLWALVASNSVVAQNFLTLTERMVSFLRVMNASRSNMYPPSMPSQSGK